MAHEAANPQSGLTPEEAAVMQALVLAWDSFAEITKAEPRGDAGVDSVADFRRSIHECQRIIAQRVVARQFPGYWR